MKSIDCITCAIVITIAVTGVGYLLNHIDNPSTNCDSAITTMLTDTDLRILMENCK